MVERRSHNQDVVGSSLARSPSEWFEKKACKLQRCTLSHLEAWEEWRLYFLPRLILNSLKTLGRLQYCNITTLLLGLEARLLTAGRCRVSSGLLSLSVSEQTASGTGSNDSKSWEAGCLCSSKADVVRLRTVENKLLGKPGWAPRKAWRKKN